MIQLFLLPLVFLGPSKIIALESKETPLKRIEHASRGENGGFLAAIDTTLWHWDSSGKLLRKIDCRGKSEDELVSLMWYHWDGNYYLLGNGELQMVTLFDRQGHFLSRSSCEYRNLIGLGTQTLALDYSGYDVRAHPFPRVLQEIELEVRENSLSFSKLPLLFKKVSQRQVNYRLNNKMVWVVKEGDTYLVADELEPKILIYDQAAREAESGIGNNQPYVPEHIPLQLTQYVLPMANPRMESGMTPGAWLASWSQINFFGIAANGFLVGYTSPDPNREAEQVQVAELLKEDGTTTGKTVVVRGRILGNDKNEVYFIVPETGNGRHFAVHVYDL